MFMFFGNAIVYVLQTTTAHRIYHIALLLVNVSLFSAIEDVWLCAKKKVLGFTNWLNTFYEHFSWIHSCSQIIK